MNIVGRDDSTNLCTESVFEFVSVATEIDSIRQGIENDIDKA